ncbi:hypothetical protein ACFQX6_37235 [Streptosporangium lutulentum]
MHETDDTGDHRNLTAGMTVCPSDLAQVTDGPPLALFADGLDTAIHRLDPGARRFQRISSVEGFAGSLTASRSGEVVAALASTAYEPKNVHAGPPAGRLVRLSDTRPELRAVRWGVQERLSYKASDGLDLDGLLILPAGKSRRTARSRSSPWCTAAPTPGTPTSSISPGSPRGSGSRPRDTRSSCPTREAVWDTATRSRRRSRAGSAWRNGPTSSAGSTC